MKKNPPFRKLRGYAFDPSMSLEMDAPPINGNGLVTMYNCERFNWFVNNFQGSDFSHRKFISYL